MYECHGGKSVMVCSGKDFLLAGDVLATVPFRFPNTHSCNAIAAMPLAFPFTREMLDFMEVSFGIKAFDLLGIPSFSKRLMQESNTVIEALNLAHRDHNVGKVVLFQTVDFHKGGKRFQSQEKEDLYHIQGLIKSRKLLNEIYPEIETSLIYVRLVNGQSEIEMSEIFDDGRERVRLVTPFRFKDVSMCNTYLVMCMDFRFRKEARSCVRYSLGIDQFGLIGLPGSSKRFLEDSRAAWKSLEIAVQKHGCKRIILMHHSDCGAYGGVEYFGWDYSAEELAHRMQMIEFERRVKEKYPHIGMLHVYARLSDDRKKIQFVRYE